MTPEERKALDGFVAAVRAHYGARLHDILVFGSRARGDNKPDSDVDVAVIFLDANWDYWTRKLELVDMTWEALRDQDLLIQPWPVSKSVWDLPEMHPKPHFVESVRRDARPVSEAA
jgi:predicted nucleotidyltransferase